MLRVSCPLPQVNPWLSGKLQAGRETTHGSAARREFPEPDRRAAHLPASRLARDSIIMSCEKELRPGRDLATRELAA
jgi:hypothetical protein